MCATNADLTTAWHACGRRACQLSKMKLVLKNPLTNYEFVVDQLSSYSAVESGFYERSIHTLLGFDTAPVQVHGWRVHACMVLAKPRYGHLCMPPMVQPSLWAGT